MRISPVNNLYFRAKMTEDEKDKKKVSGSEVAVATGATGSAVAAGKGSIKSFSQANHKINATAKNAKKAVDLATDTTKQAKGILGKFVKNCERYKGKIIEFGQNATNSKYLKPILTSSAYKGFAGVAGGLTAGVVAISGIGDMVNTFARKAEQYSQD